MEGTAFINGRHMPIDQASISVLDSGFGMGANVFDTISAHQGCIFKLRQHLDRFFRSLHAARFPFPYTKDEFSAVVVDTVRRSGLRDAYIQCVATRGIRARTPMREWAPTVIVYVIPYFATVSDEAIARGVRLRTSSIRNLPSLSLDAKIKSFNRLHFYLARLEAEDSGADSPILLDLEGHVTEGPGANLFVVSAGRLFTPSEGILQGITRQTVFEIAESLAISAQEADLTPYDLYNADEVFYSSTAGGIMPVVEVDGRRVGDGRPGPITRRVEQAYWRLHVEGPDATRIFE